MTPAPTCGHLRSALMRPGGVLLRFLAVLALLLFGAPQGQPLATMDHAAPVAQVQAGSSDGLLNVQRHLARAHPGDDTASPALARWSTVAVRPLITWSRLWPDRPRAVVAGTILHHPQGRAPPET